MTDKKPRRKLRCTVSITDKVVKIKPCTALDSVLHGSAMGAGIRIAHMINFDDREVSRARLVLAPPKKQGNGMIANFCPMCGAVLTMNGNGFAKANKP